MSDTLSDETKAAYLQQIKHLEWLARIHRAEITEMNRVLARKNIELAALHFVWCSGPCGTPLTREIVEEAFRNTNRLIEKFNGQYSNGVWKTLLPEDQAVMLTAWKDRRDREHELYKQVQELKAENALLRERTTR